MIDAKDRAENNLRDRRTRLAAQRTSLAQSGEENPARGASGLSQKNDTRIGTTMFGRAINRPTTGDLLKKGTQGMLYFATDTNALSAWTGSAWKSVVVGTDFVGAPATPVTFTVTNGSEDRAYDADQIGSDLELRDVVYSLLLDLQDLGLVTVA